MIIPPLYFIIKYNKLLFKGYYFITQNSPLNVFIQNSGNLPNQKLFKIPLIYIKYEIRYIQWKSPMEK